MKDGDGASGVILTIRLRIHIPTALHTAFTAYAGRTSAGGWVGSARSLKTDGARTVCDEERAGAPAPGADCPADALVCREPRPAAGVPGSFYLSSARIILIINAE